MVRRWNQSLQKINEEPSYLSNATHIEPVQAIFSAALGLIKGGHLKGIVEAVRAETVAELLEQSEMLVNKNYHVAAAVLAGGSLETHIRHLCERNGITWRGDGSISNYNDAIAQERNKGNAVYDANDGKSVTAWGGQRNAAAHDPVNFNATVGEVRLMVQGIRQFISKTS